MTVLAYDPQLSEEKIGSAGSPEGVVLDELLLASDFVSLHCPLNAHTDGMIGRDQFALMKPTAYFVTTARGGIHKEDDLAEALAAGAIAGAGLDVFLDEPPDYRHPLLSLEKAHRRHAAQCRPDRGGQDFDGGGVGRAPMDLHYRRRPSPAPCSIRRGMGPLLRPVRAPDRNPAGRARRAPNPTMALNSASSSVQCRSAAGSL